MEQADEVAEHPSQLYAEARLVAVAVVGEARGLLLVQGDERRLAGAADVPEREAAPPRLAVPLEQGQHAERGQPVLLGPGPVGQEEQEGVVGPGAADRAREEPDRAGRGPRRRARRTRRRGRP